MSNIGRYTYERVWCDDVDDGEDWIEKDDAGDDDDLYELGAAAQQLVEISLAVPQRRQLLLTARVCRKLTDTEINN